MKKHYNLQHLVKIKVFDFDISPTLFYVKERKTFWGRIVPAHIQNRYRGLCMQVALDKYKDIKIVGHRVHFKPKCILYFTGDFEQSFTFNTYQEAMDKAEAIKKQAGNWISVTEG